MTSATPPAGRVVIGGGITGLAAAHRLHELAPHDEVILLEASPRLGGVIRTERREGFLIEHGADSFITSMPGGIELCRRIGFADKLLDTDEANRRAFVLCRGKLQAIPSGFLIMAPSRLGPMLTTRVLSLWGKLRMGMECLTPRRRDLADESLASFATRRFGREAYERLIQPLVGGIYTADPTRLSAAAAMPRFVEMERSSRSRPPSAGGNSFERRRHRVDENARRPLATLARRRNDSGGRGDVCATGARHDKTPRAD
jgi:protoporphyrinogen/coproporphyrinogen III oxidase